MCALYNQHDNGFYHDAPAACFDALQSSINKMPSSSSMNQRPPFLDPMEDIGIQQYDVLKIKNVPFGVSIPEIRSFIAHLTKSPLIKEHVLGYPVHIIMERPTGKTLDAFVELRHRGAAQTAIQQAERNINEDKGLKIGTRHVEIELSSEGDLCAALFPRAKSVHWDPDTGVPTVISNQDPYSDGFQGFFTVEEIASVCRHAQFPNKSTFSQRSHQRVYESMISTLYKFPWNVPSHYSVKARDLLCDSYMGMLHVLVGKVLPSDNRPLYGEFSREVGLNHTLLMDFLFAGLNVPMFSLRKKFEIVHAAGELGPGFDLPEQAAGWPFEALIPAKTHDSQSIDGWIQVLNNGFQKMIKQGIRHGYEQYLKIKDNEYGYKRIELNDAGKALTFHKLISIEKALMEFVIEEARIDWYKHWGVPFSPLCLWGVPSHAVQGFELGDHMQSLSLSSSISERSVARHSLSSSRMASPIPNNPDDEEQPGNKGQRTIKAIDNKAHNNPSSIHVATPTQFNPATPPFIPSQPWSVINDDANQSDLVAGNEILQFHTSRSESSFGTYPGMSQTSKLPARHRSNSIQTPRSVSASFQQRAAGGTQSMSDPFLNIVSPQGRRRPSLPISRLSNSKQPDIFDQSERPNNMTNPVPFNNHGLDNAQQGRSAFDSIWVPSIPDSSSAPTNVTMTPTRRSASSGSGSANTSPLRSARSKSVSSPSAGKHAPSPGPYQNIPHFYPASGSPANMQGRPNTFMGNEPPIWSPTNELLVLKRHIIPAPSRASAGRNAFRPQATIDEEGDMSTVETADGGVRLHEEN